MDTTSCLPHQLLLAWIVGQFQYCSPLPAVSLVEVGVVAVAAVACWFLAWALEGVVVQWPSALQLSQEYLQQSETVQGGVVIA